MSTMVNLTLNLQLRGGMSKRELSEVLYTAAKAVRRIGSEAYDRTQTPPTVTQLGFNVEDDAGAKLGTIHVEASNKRKRLPTSNQG